METIPLKWKVKNCPEVGAYYDRKCKTSCYSDIESHEILFSHNFREESILEKGSLSASFGSGDYNVPEITLEQFRELTNTRKQTKYGVMGCHELVEYFIENEVYEWKGDSSLLIYYKSGDCWKTVSMSTDAGKDFTPTTLENYLKIINETPNTTMKKISQSAKTLSVTKTETVLIGKKKREITITVLIQDGKVRAGYSVRNPEDKKSNPELAKQISTGRALSDKTNLVDMTVGIGMDKKYILYAIAEQILRQVGSGTIQIKGVK